MAVFASGHKHSLYVDHLGSVWSCGSNEYGQLGLGHSTNKQVPEKINNLPPIVSVSAGCHFSLFVGANGNVWSCGINGYGQLGLGDKSNRNVPEQITGLPKIILTSAIGTLSIFLDYNGSVWACGRNTKAELRSGDTIDKNKAEKIEGIPKIKSIAGGWNHLLFLDCEGSVWSCGHNGYGHLGLGDTKHRSKAEKIEGLPKIKSIAAGVHSSMFVDEECNVWICGANEYGQLGLGHTSPVNSPQKNNNLSGIVAVAGGNRRYLVFLDKEGNVFTCGNNAHGQLGLGDTSHRNSCPQKVNNIPPISGLSSCNTASYYLQIVDSEGRVWSCGNNENGQLGLGHTNQTFTFQRIETIWKLKKQDSEMQSEKEMFKSVEIDQSKALMDKLKSTVHFTNLNKEQAKQKIITGVIGMADWSSKWKDIHANNQGHQLCITQKKEILRSKQQQLEQLTLEVNQQMQELATAEEEQGTLEFYDRLIEPIAEAETELRSGFEEKLKAGKFTEFTVDEVSLFLNVCGMGDLVTHQREKKIDGELLKMAIEDVTVMGIKDRLQKWKMKFYLKVLGSGKMMQQELSQSMVWRHREVGQTTSLLKEKGIGTVEQWELLGEKGISICHLLYCKVKDFQEVLGIDMKGAIAMVRRWRGYREKFEKFLASE